MFSLLERFLRKSYKVHPSFVAAEDRPTYDNQGKPPKNAKKWDTAHSFKTTERPHKTCPVTGKPSVLSHHDFVRVEGEKIPMVILYSSPDGEGFDVWVR